MKYTLRIILMAVLVAWQAPHQISSMLRTTSQRVTNLAKGSQSVQLRRTATWRDLQLAKSVKRGSICCTEFYQRIGANPNSKSSDGKPLFHTLLSAACAYQKKIIPATPHLPVTRFTPTWRARPIKSNAYDRLKHLVSSPHFESIDTINAQDEDGNTALHVIAKLIQDKEVNIRNTYSVIEFLLANGADPLIENNEGITAIKAIENCGDESFIKLLEQSSDEKDTEF